MYPKFQGPGFLEFKPSEPGSSAHCQEPVCKEKSAAIWAEYYDLKSENMSHWRAYHGHEAHWRGRFIEQSPASDINISHTQRRRT